MTTMHTVIKSKTWRRFFGGIGMTVCYLTSVGEAQAETRQVPVPKSLVVTAFNAALSGTTVYVDTYGEKRGTTWFSNKSTITLPNGTRKPIENIDEFTFGVTDRRQLKYYIDDLHSQSLSASVDGSRIKVTLAFESQGEEIKGKCVRDPVVGKPKECTLKMERDVHLNNARIDIWLTPQVNGTGLSFAPSPQVRFSADLQIANRLCQTFKGICSKIEDAALRRVRAAVEASLVKAFDSQRAELGQRVMGYAALASKTTGYRLTGISDSGTNFVLTLDR